MAMGLRFTCSHCDKAIEAWSDGNPYYLDERGKKRYAYHPNHELLELCIGNDLPHLCLTCGHRFKVDSRRPVTSCRKCRSSSISPDWELEGKGCPYCQKGRFRVDPDYWAIS